MKINILCIILLLYGCSTYNTYQSKYQKTIEFVRNNVAIELNLDSDRMKYMLLDHSLYRRKFCSNICPYTLRVDFVINDSNISKFSNDLYELVYKASYTLYDKDNNIIFSDDLKSRDIYNISREIYYSHLIKEKTKLNQLQIMMNDILIQVYYFISISMPDII
jgi:hypothetical protein